MKRALKRILLMLAAAISFTFAAKADAEPQFPGGAEALGKYVAENLTYPAAAIDNGIEGTVNVQFMVLKDGSIGTIKIVRMIDPDLEQEAIRLVKKMPAWTPAEKGGVAIDAPVVLPIKFSLPE